MCVLFGLLRLGFWFSFFASWLVCYAHVFPCTCAGIYVLLYVLVHADPENTTCFGEEFGQFITKYFLGYEMMIIASFKNLLPQIQGLVVFFIKYYIYIYIHRPYIHVQDQGT